MKFSEHKFSSFFLMLALSVLSVACSKQLNLRMIRVAKIAARPQEVRPLPKPTVKPTGTDKSKVPLVDENPSKEPKRIYLGGVTLTKSVQDELISNAFNPDINCFQYVYSNGFESVEISNGACPNKLAAWKDVVVTVYFESPGNDGLYVMYHPEQTKADLGLLMEDPDKPMNALIGSFCTGSFRLDASKDTPGCKFDIRDDGLIQGMDVLEPKPKAADAPVAPPLPTP